MLTQLCGAKRLCLTVGQLSPIKRSARFRAEGAGPSNGDESGQRSQRRSKLIDIDIGLGFGSGLDT